MKLKGSTAATAATLTICLFSIALAGCSDDPAETKRAALVKGNQYLENQQLNEAIIEFRRAIQIDPNFGEARKQLSAAYLESGDARNALREVVRAADLLPSDAELQLRAGNMLLAASQFEDARGRADRILASHSNHAGALVLRGNALANLRDLDGALKELEEAASAAPADGLIRSNIGIVQLARGEQDKAEESFRKATELAPSAPAAYVSYANYLQAARRPGEAEEQLKKAFRVAPADVNVNRALAILYLTTNRTTNAEPHLKALAGASSNADARFALARFYAATNRREDAMRELRTLAAAKPTYVDASLQIASIHYSSGQRAEARQLLDEVTKSAPTDPRVMLANADFLLRERRFGESITAARSALSRDPRLVAAHFFMGMAHEGLREFDEAKKAFNEVLRLEPNAVRAQLALSRLHLIAGEPQQAQQLATQAAVAAPRSPEVRQTLIRALIANNKISEAESALRSYHADEPKDAAPYALEGMLRVRQRDFAAAERAFTMATTLDPKSMDVASGRAQMLLASGRHAEAKQYVAGLVTFNPENADILLLAARTLGSLRDFAATEPLLRKVLSLDATRSEAYSMLAQAFAMQGKLDEALTEYRTLAARRPTAGSHTVIGTVLRLQNKRAEAKQAYRDALAVDSASPVAANNLAWLMAEDGDDLDTALELAQTAKSRMPESADAADTLGWIYFKKGLHTLAVNELRQAVDKRPADAGFNYRLGFAYAKTGDLGLARRTLESAIKMDPKAPQVNEARAVLSKLSVLGS